MTTITLPEAEIQLRRLPRKFRRDPDQSVAITDGGKDVMVVLSSERYESLVETAEVRGDSALMQSLVDGIEEIQAGKAIGWEAAKQHLGW